MQSLQNGHCFQHNIVKAHYNYIFVCTSTSSFSITSMRFCTIARRVSKDNQKSIRGGGNVYIRSK